MKTTIKHLFPQRCNVTSHYQEINNFTKHSESNIILIATRYGFIYQQSPQKTYNTFLLAREVL